jgi:hypothetical protein
MASSAAQAAPPQNREYLFIGGADEEFLCGICLDILQDPHSCCKEGHTYCLTCITDALKCNHQCPTCRQAVMGLVKNRAIQNMIDKSTVGCPHGDSSSTTTQEPLRKWIKSSVSSSSACCSWQGPYKDLSQHLKNDCELAVCDCPLQGCSEKMLREALPDHQLDCPYRMLTCHRCGSIDKAFAADIHEEVCPEVEIVCSNTEIRNGTTVDDCKQKYKRKDAFMHESVCKLTNVGCVYAPFGCRGKCLRKDMNQHLVDKVLSHVEMSVFKLLRTSNDYTQLQNQLAQTEDKFEAQLSKMRKKVTWQVDWPLPAGTFQLDSKKLIVGEYRCWLKVAEGLDHFGVFFCARAVQVSERQFLFPASLTGSSITVSHPSDDQESIQIHFNDTNSDLMHENGSSLGLNPVFTATEALDFVHNGKLTIRAEIQIAPAMERVFSLN